MRALRLNLLKGIVALCLLPMASCKLSNVGNQDEPVPKAVATSIGQSFTTDSSGNMSTTVRAGSEVVLTGKESEKGADDTGVPLINFKWLQNPSDTTQVQVINRTSNTVSFTAPQATQDTTLRFTLTVSDAKGATASTQANVLVKPVRDPDHFLQYLNGAVASNNQFSIELATLADIQGNSSSAISATDQLPVTIKITKLLTFVDRNSGPSVLAATYARVPVGKSITVSSGWATRLGSSATCGAPVNPTVQVPIPRLDLDDSLPSLNDAGDPLPPLAKAELARLKAAYPDATLLSDVLEPADIGKDSIKMELQIDLSSNTGVPKPCVKDAANNLIVAPEQVGGTVSSVIVPVETTSVPAVSGLWPANATNRDSRAAATAYFKTIDPTDAKTTLDDWLYANGFDPTKRSTGWNADAHAIYTNNFDLGFGRDMYMKTSNCDSGAAALPLQQRFGKCDVAAVVVNYSGVEAAAKGLNPIVAVAMEYSAAPGTASRFVKFYTFTPDTRDGVYRRVLSVNLDRRGEQYMPQACVVCHGGLPASATPPITAAPYPAGGNVNAVFLPWDLDSFLYSSDPDSGFSTKARDADLKAKYTRAQQLAQFKLLNTGAYLTFDDVNRHALARELVEGWYGGPGLPSSSFNSAFVPPGWKPEGIDGVAGNGDDNPLDSATIYTDVFARNCRACHVVQVPTAGDPRTSAACSSTSTVVNTTHQLAMGCYWQFANAPFLAQVLSEGRMPFARRTMDRLWVDAAQWVDSTGTTKQGSKGDMLYAHLRTTFNAINQPTKAAALAIPGSPMLSISVTPSNSDVSDWLGLSVTDGLSDLGFNFIAQPSWNVCVPLSGNTTCSGATSVFPVAGFSSNPGKFQVPRSGSLLVEFTSGAQTISTATISVPPNRPSINALPAQVQRQHVITLSGDSLIVPGNGPTGNALSAHKWWISDLQNLVSSTTCVVSSPCTVKGSTITLSEIDAVAASGSFTVNVIDADDSPTNPVTGTQTVTITSGLTISAKTGRAVANSSKGTVYQDNALCTPSTVGSCTQFDLLQDNVASAGTSLTAQICAGTSAAQCNALTSTVCSTASTSSTGCTTTGVNFTGTVFGKAFLNGLQLLYTPPATYATNPPSGQDSTGAPATKPHDQLYYRLVELDSTNMPLDYSNWVPIEIKVLARKSFPTDVVQNIFQRNTASPPSGQGSYPSAGSSSGSNSTCTSCHYPSAFVSPIAGALAFANNDSSAKQASDIYLQMIPTAIGTSGRSKTAVVQATGQNRPYVDLTNATGNSAIFMHPANTDSYTSSSHAATASNNRCPSGFGSSTCDLTDVIIWIQDGANPF